MAVDLPTEIYQSIFLKGMKEEDVLVLVGMKLGITVKRL